MPQMNPINREIITFSTCSVLKVRFRKSEYTLSLRALSRVKRFEPADFLQHQGEVDRLIIQSTEAGE